MKVGTVKKKTEKRKQHKIVVYGESWCPYCKNAKILAKKLTKDFKFISGKSGMQLKKLLKLKNIPKTIPLVVVDGKYIGGFSNLQSIKK